MADGAAPQNRSDECPDLQAKNIQRRHRCLRGDAWRRPRAGLDQISEVVIVADQKPAVLAYVRRRNMQSDPEIKHVSVGDTLPDSGIRYYEIPLRYGAPFYRCVVIGEEVVIADPSTGRVIQVVD